MARADASLGRWLYESARANPVLKVSAELLSFSGDELIWFLIPAVYISGGFAARLLAAVNSNVWPLSAGNLHCLEEIGCNVFGTLGVCCSVECAIKLIIKRVRPEYAKQSAGYVLPGEQVDRRHYYHYRRSLLPPPPPSFAAATDHSHVASPTEPPIQPHRSTRFRLVTPSARSVLSIGCVTPIMQPPSSRLPLCHLTVSPHPGCGRGRRWSAGRGSQREGTSPAMCLQAR